MMLGHLRTTSRALKFLSYELEACTQEVSRPSAAIRNLKCWKSSSNTQKWVNLEPRDLTLELLTKNEATLTNHSLKTNNLRENLHASSKGNKIVSPQLRTTHTLPPHNRKLTPCIYHFSTLSVQKSLLSSVFYRLTCKQLYGLTF
jgi:hypothetical protein